MLAANPNWFDLYECEHITDKTHRPMMTVPAGPHSNVLLCKHCQLHLRGLVLQDMLTDLLREPLTLGQVATLKQLFGTAGESNG